VAFEHLERLVALGYLEVAHRRGLPGKPAKIYKLTGGPVQISHPARRYDVVAESLAQAFEGLGDIGSHAVRRAGRAYGAQLAQPGAKSVLAALEPLIEMGADYETRGGMVDCTNCLFAEVCRRAPVICRFHAGVLEGILENSHAHVSVKAMGFRDPYGCAYMLEEGEGVEPLAIQAQA
jgi:predicted ArsR family transcriptional regulator